jgi:osmotically-inducible protein OsmY
LTDGKEGDHFPRRLARVALKTQIQPKPETKPEEIEQKTIDALRHDAELDAMHIIVEAHNGVVIPTEKVRSWIKREEAERFTRPRRV